MGFGFVIRGCMEVRGEERRERRVGGVFLRIDV
jgi:hypothetical protein